MINEGEDAYAADKYKNILSWQLWWYILVICKIELILMSTLSYHQFIAFIQQILSREMCYFYVSHNKGCTLSKMLQSRSTLIFSFFLPHMKLESSVEFLFDFYLK